MTDFLTLKHYKEPLRAVPEKDGFGYYGTIQVTMDGCKIQCHKCGGLYEDLNGHVRAAHKLSVDKYRENYDLSRTTALISESERDRRKQRTLEWLKSMTEKERQRMKKKSREQFIKWKKAQIKGKWKERLETKNKKGSCPQQILQKILDCKKELKHTPSLAEFVDFCDGQRYKHLIYKVYGSWSGALKILGIYEKKSHGRKTLKKQSHSTEELLEALNIFAQENRKIPTATDAKRGLIPDYYTYIRRFGSFEAARKKAGVYQFTS